MNPVSTCQHDTCANILQFTNGRHNGAAVVILNSRPFNGNFDFLAGFEKFGKFEGMFNITTGSWDKNDGLCFEETCIREFSEEMDVQLNQEQFERYNTDLTTGNRMICMIAFTPIFFLIIDGPDQINVPAQNRKIFMRAKKSSNPCHQEIQSIHLIRTFDINKQNNRDLAEVYTSILLAVCRARKEIFSDEGVFLVSSLENKIVGVCSAGKYCTNNDCTYNHYCSYGKSCRNKPDKCRFSHL